MMINPYTTVTESIPAGAQRTAEGTNIRKLRRLQRRRKREMVERQRKKGIRVQTGAARTEKLGHSHE